MKISRRNLIYIIENYLREQAEEEEVVDDTEATDDSDDSGAPPDDESGEPPADEEAEEDPMAAEEEGSQDEEPAEETPEEPPEEEFPDKLDPFEIIVDKIKHRVQFIKDKTDNVLKVMIDGEELKNPKPQDFVTLAGTALTAEKNPEKRAHLEKIVKIDKSLAKYDDVDSIVSGKIKGSRPGFTEEDYRKIGLGKGSSKG